ncbi:MAG: type I-U CRISPR-associated helicase/endonuclease Cas3 [Magnetococcales bacterium]|nr:type I-U CRISPR-associated helicase/endonuclease Cas3 [Magnetococcales bacterium]NGZ25947.1 type I-U CRISPR-associated helicase/endonuclease Cas3 [Magnetococcales bacterium]
MNLNDFSDYFLAVHGCTPFPWQQRLLQQVVRDRHWPETISLPTAAGKTGVLDVALFCLALEATTPPQERKARLRMVLVVDRRLVVDNAHERAEKIKTALQQPTTPLLQGMADQLCRLSGTKSPLEVVKLRGGIPQEKGWAQNPTQPMIILSTVDQVGSRLLFRGYGVSEQARPIHAGILGEDSLLFLDEAHLSQPFWDTLKLIGTYQGESWRETPPWRPLQAISLTATPRGEGGQFCLEEEDRTHGILKKRISASKLAKLIEKKGDVTDEIWIQSFMEAAKELMTKLAGQPSPVVGIIVNRIATARGIHSLLKEDGHDAELLTGRGRPLEQIQLQERLLPRIRAGRAGTDVEKPLFVVATQTVEVGADLDFDAIVTEAAPLDALKQRFGRLNRLGAHEVSQAIVIFGTKKHKNDFIYGDAIEKTFNWLKSKGGNTFDFGISSMLSHDTTDPSLFSPSEGNSPILLPAHMDLLAQTSPIPRPDPELAPYLHGPQSGNTDIHLIFRDDIEDDYQIEKSVAAIVGMLPPSSLEAISLPLHVVKSWLTKKTVYPLSDVERGDSDNAKEETDQKVFIWQKMEESTIDSINNVKPGNTLVVPTSWGGMDEFGWQPESPVRVKDLAEKACLVQRDQVVLRIHSSRVESWFPSLASDHGKAVWQQITELLQQWQERPHVDLAKDILVLLAQQEGLEEESANQVQRLLNQSKRQIIPYPMSDDQEIPEGVVILGKKGSFREEGDETSLTNDILLDDHLSGVERYAGHFATLAGLDMKLVADLQLAGKLHDVGKMDPRFQILLRGGERLLFVRDGSFLAKSVIAMPTRQMRQRARERAGYPKGGRHEAYSVYLLEKYHELMATAHDRELVLHLIGTHHGYGRPFLPWVEDPGVVKKFVWHGMELSFDGSHKKERLDSGWLSRYAILNRRYGWWGLAYLESLLRLADHRQSAEEVENE